MLRKSTKIHDKKQQIHKKTLDYRHVTDVFDYKKIGVVLKNRRVFDEHVSICLTADGP